uniref:Uncharacterized protein n=1 Tax=Curvibacter symbiont subsp. Hydra magnipapillata TaxID=667019 RepID=C9YCX0_CURXX|nr:hypothetical protein Csp_C25490 [Curvibacter putative symbiont of Hydra magnipapillata]
MRFPCELWRQQTALTGPSLRSALHARNYVAGNCESAAL